MASGLAWIPLRKNSNWRTCTRAGMRPGRSGRRRCKPRSKVSMLKLLLARPRAAGHRILCLGAHSDDLEIGCGGTILRLLNDHKNISLQWVVFSANHTSAKEARRSAEMFLDKAK